MRKATRQPARSSLSRTAPNFELWLDTYRAGESPSLEVGFDIIAGELEPYQVELRLPPEFRFEGFAAGGPAHSPIGQYGLDGDFDGVPDHVVLLRVRSDLTAYADLIPDGRYTPGIEPLLEAQADGLVLTLPGGGDMDTGSLTVPLDASASLSLVSGLFVNAREVGDYTFAVTVTSVDPDTGGPNDFQGSAPLTLSLSEAVMVEPAQVDFDDFVVTGATVKCEEPLQDDFKVDGWFALGAESDGIDPPSEAVEIFFGPFAATLAPGSFYRDHDEYKSAGGKPGLYEVEIEEDGAFELEAEGVDLVGLDPNGPVPFVLRIGDDIGQTEILFDGRDRFEFDGDCG